MSYFYKFKFGNEFSKDLFEQGTCKTQLSEILSEFMKKLPILRNFKVYCKVVVALFVYFFRNFSQNFDINKNNLQFCML